MNADGRVVDRNVSSTRRRWVLTAGVAAMALTAVVVTATEAVGVASDAARGDQVLYRDALQRPSASHPQISAPETPLQFEHGSMRARETVSGDATYIAAKDLPGTTGQLANVAVEANVTKNNGTTTAGVFCRGTVTGSYVFVIGARRFGIYKGTAAGATQGSPYAYQPLMVRPSPKAIHPGTESNHLRGECTETPGGVRLRLLVNGKALATQVDATSPNPVGGGGLYIEADQGAKGDASFSKLVIAHLVR